MNTIDSTKEHGKTKIEKAERAVEHSVERFESAMEGLASRVEDSSERLHHSVDLANKSKDDLLRMKDSVKSAVDPLKPYFRRAVETSSDLANRIQKNPRPYLFSFAAFIGSLLLIGYFQGRKSNRIRSGVDFDVERNRVPIENEPLAPSQTVY